MIHPDYISCHYNGCIAMACNVADGCAFVLVTVMIGSILVGVGVDFSITLQTYS